MQRAALYARVSTDAQKQEGTIESQIAELRRQIAAAGHVLVKEYIDDGYTGSRMDRPALQELRRDLKADIFDVIYFLAADRIARAVIYQTIIIGEMLLHKKDIVINGQQYIDKSENKFTMTVLGAVGELERAKITERMTRGKLHRLRQGVMASGGVAPFGYRYTQASANAPRALAPQEPEAEVVRWLFETYAAGATLRSLAKSLERRGVRTRFGKELWAYAQIRDMMNNPTYAGMRYFNRRTEVKDDPQRKRGRTILRDRSEWPFADHRPKKGLVRLRWISRLGSSCVALTRPLRSHRRSRPLYFSRLVPVLSGFQLRHHLQQRSGLNRKLPCKRPVVSQYQQQGRGHPEGEEPHCDCSGEAIVAMDHSDRNQHAGRLQA